MTGIDVDKMDYMRRDAKALGLKTKFNFLRFVEAGEPRLVEVPYSPSGPMVKRIAVREKVVKTIQDLFLDRTDLHATAYQHKTAIMFNLMYMDVWVLADAHIKVAGRDGSLLCLSEACMDEVALARLTEGWLHQTIRNSTDPGLAAARALLLRIDQRKMYRFLNHQFEVKYFLFKYPIKYVSFKHFQSGGTDPRIQSDSSCVSLREGAQNQRWTVR